MNFITTMNKRERFLLVVTAAVIGLLVNFYLIKFFLANRADLTRQLAGTQVKIDTLKKRETERELWAKRDAWLNEKLPVLGDPDVASKALRESILEIAKKHTVTLEAPQPSTPVNQPGHISLAVKFDVKAPWDAMFNFLYELQGPEKFIAIENCELKVNREDKTQLRATITIARWYAPK
jgi:Type II secretion system (T2SS), protein M subtype b